MEGMDATYTSPTKRTPSIYGQFYLEKLKREEAEGELQRLKELYGQQQLVIELLLKKMDKYKKVTWPSLKSV